MPRPDQTNPVVVAYARSLLELAEERGLLEQVNRELQAVRELIQTNPPLRALLRNPAVSSAERAELIQRVFAGRFSQLLVDFLQVANQKGRLGELEAIADAYDDLLDERLGKIEVDVTVAKRLSPDELEEVRRRVSAVLGKEAVVHQYIDDSIIGGLILRVQDRLIDASVRAQLQAMKRKMLAAQTKQ